MTSTHELCIQARTASDAFHAAGRDPTDCEATGASTMPARTYRSMPTTFAEVATIAALALEADVDPTYRAAFESICKGAEMLAKGGMRRGRVDPALARCEAARAAERELWRSLNKRDVGAEDLAPAEAALDRAYTTVPTTAAGIAALAGLVALVEDLAYEPELAAALRAIWRGAERIAVV